MHRYQHYQAEDFIWDDAFRAWVLAPTRETHSLWSQWLAKNPTKVTPVTVAREVVLTLQCRGPTLTDKEIKRRVRETLSRLS